MIPKLNSPRNQARRRRIFFTRAKVASKSIDSPGESGEQAGVCVPPLRVCPLMGPFFRVFEGERRIGGFPFGLHRNAPKSAVLGLYPWAHRIDRIGTHAWGDVLSPRRKASTQDAPVCHCARIWPYQVPDATSAVSSVPSRTHRQVNRKPPRTKPQQTRRPSPRCGAS